MHGRDAILWQITRQNIGQVSTIIYGTHIYADTESKVSLPRQHGQKHAQERPYLLQ